jgi:23S rRNA pseudouridine1911/1915/1917 synthase
MPGASNRTLRQMLAQGRVCLNGKPCKIAAQKVKSGDVVELGKPTAERRLQDGLKILYEDRDILVIHKPAGLLTVATIHERERTAFSYLRSYLKQHSPKQKLYIVHRLDKFASGLLVFAKSEKVKAVLQSTFKKHDIQRKYWAIVEGNVEKDRGTIRSYLAEDDSLRMHSTNDRACGKPAVTHYRVLRRFADVTALEVTLETGRKNQIRVHLSEMGHPIVGDRAYGSTQNPLGRLGLHAFHLEFAHPVKSTIASFHTEAPPEFRRYLPGKFATADKTPPSESSKNSETKSVKVKEKRRAFQNR